MKRTKFAMVALITGAASLVMAAAPAQAGRGSHCWQDLATGKTACFSSYQQVVKAISHGRVDVAPGATAVTDKQRAQIADGTEATYIIGMVYLDKDYLNSSFTYTATGDCDTNSDVDWQVGSMATGWDNKVSSFRSYGLCATKLFEAPNWGVGATYGFYVNSAWVGAAMNDQTSSIQWN